MVKNWHLYKDLGVMWSRDFYPSSQFFWKFEKSNSKIEFPIPKLVCMQIFNQFWGSVKKENAVPKWDRNRKRVNIFTFAICQNFLKSTLLLDFLVKVENSSKITMVYMVKGQPQLLQLNR